MSTEALLKEVEGMPEDTIKEGYDFVLFLKSRNKKVDGQMHRRILGLWSKEPFYMTDDFDETPDCFGEYI